MRSLRVMGVVAAVAFIGLEAGRAATLAVANDGVDSALCGSKAAPCRSIGRALANAGAGDKIVVGPGHYGDLDNDGILGAPGEEQPSNCDTGATAVICIDKPVTLLSRDGAPLTVIDVGDAPDTHLVIVNSPGASLGAPRKGFTLIGGATAGLDAVLVTGSGATVAGNRLTARTVALELTGTGHVAKGNQLIGSIQGLSAEGADHRIEGNEALGNTGRGFGLDACDGCRLAGNLAVRNGGNGFTVTSDSPGLVVEGNVATANGGAGFFTGVAGTAEFAAANALFRGNVAVRNNGAGFDIRGTDLVLTGNAAIGNAVAGVAIAAESAAPLLTRNHFVGNGSPNGSGCGVSNSAPSPVDATSSYWGAATGPGARPADAACSGAGEVDATPFATKPIKVKPKLPRIE